MRSAFDRRARPLASLLLLAAAACSPGHGTAATSGDALPAESPGAPATSVRVIRKGGIAAIQQQSDVALRGAESPSYVYKLGGICIDEPCPPARDSSAGPLSQASADAILRALDAAGVFELRDDYGVTHNAADMMTIAVTVRRSGRTKTIVADDGTVPAELRPLLDAIARAVPPRR